ncbi:hypothetical protein ANTPLA_LOCUS3798 [Anthophora plagiata]
MIVLGALFIRHRISKRISIVDYCAIVHCRDPPATELLEPFLHDDEKESHRANQEKKEKRKIETRAEHTKNHKLRKPYILRAVDANRSTLDRHLRVGTRDYRKWTGTRRSPDNGIIRMLHSRYTDIYPR